MLGRSFLFIPGDSEKKLGKADATGADALILDLEDSVAPSRKAAARGMVPAFLRERPAGSRKSALWVRMNALDTGMAIDDLAAVASAAPDGIMIPKAGGPEDVQRIAYMLDALEAVAGVPAGHVRLMPLVTETPAAPFSIGRYVEVKLDRLFALTWGAEDLSSALGASSNLGPDGRWAETYRMVRSQCLLAAHACQVEAIETAYVDYRDPEGLRASCRAARAEGFTGRVAIHPDQVAIINEAFSPSAEEIAFARRVVDLFAANPDEGTIGLDGKMLDIPHLNQARKVLAQAAATSAA